MDNVNSTKDASQTTPMAPSNRTKEVQTIIDRMPTYWVKWVVICIVGFMGAVLLFSFLIKYPDTVDGQISVTAATAPVRLLANSNGRINLLKSNKVYLKKGDVIANIESGANYKHILLLDSVLNALITVNGDFCQLPDTLVLGDINLVYNAFRLSYLQYERLLTSDIYDNILQNMRQQIVSFVFYQTIPAKQN